MMVVVSSNVSLAPFADCVRRFLFIRAMPLKVTPFGVFQCVGAAFDAHGRVAKHERLVVCKHVNSPFDCYVIDARQTMPPYAVKCFETEKIGGFVKIRWLLRMK